MHNSVSVQENETRKILWDFETTRPSDSKTKQKKNERTCRIQDSAVLADHRVKLKKSEKRDKYIDLAREMTPPPKKTKNKTKNKNKIWNIKVTVMPIVTGSLGTVTKGLAQGLEDLERREWV